MWEKYAFLKPAGTVWYTNYDVPTKLDIHESVHRDTIMKVTNKMQLYRLIYYS